jgi:cobalt/nickel transport system permease protein
MHMADALLSPATGLVMWAAAGTALAVASRVVKARADDALVPLMGMLGAFVFAAQMINFSIPGTGSSGHLGGGLLLAMLMGPHAALVVISSVLTVQALFFADGGLLALGANIFNIGVLPCLVAYPLVYRPLAGGAPSRRRLTLAAGLAAMLALQLGAMGVVLQTVMSGISGLSLEGFAWLMLPIHAAIGVVEGAATVAIVLFVQRHRPELLHGAAPEGVAPRLRPALLAAGLATLALGGVGSWFASADPDGLEWSVQRAGVNAVAATTPAGLHDTLAAVQKRTALLPDYGLPDDAVSTSPAGDAPSTPAQASQPQAWPAVNAGTSLAGVVGGVTTLGLVLAVGLLLRRRRQPASARP